LAGLFWDGDVDAGLNYILAPLNLTLEDLRQQPGGISIPGTPHYFRYRQDGFKTHTGKIEIFSEVFRNAGEHPLPVFVEPAMSPFSTDSAEFPFGAYLRQDRPLLPWTTPQCSFVATPRS
jgi:hypothetical protein